jgi:bcr-type benzoyl-CoA reductase subunit C
MKDETEKILDTFAAIVEDPLTRLKEYKAAKGKKVIGFFLTDFPEEFIHAAGMIPIAVLGNHENISLADAYLQNYACSLVRSTLESKLNHNLDILDGMVIPHICDTTQCLASIWKITFPEGYFDEIIFPKKRHIPSARVYLLNELRRIKEGLEKYAGVNITEERLRDSIRLYNNHRKLLRELYALKRSHPQALREREFFNIIKASMLMTKEEHTQLLSQIIPSLPKRTIEPEKKIRLVVSGMVWEPPEILDLIDELGGIIVNDDFCTGSRYFLEDVELNHNTVEAIVDRQLRRLPIPGYHILSDEVGDFLIGNVEKNDAHGVIFWHLKFCDVHNFDYPDLKKRLEEKKIPHLALETELRMTSLEQIRTRLQAFMELLGGR